jgi:hypothetical protein
MTETRGRITADEKRAAESTRVEAPAVVQPKRRADCPHEVTGQPAGHGSCKCCARKVKQVGTDKAGRPVCADCDDGGPKVPKHVSFKREVVVTSEPGTCMFCSVEGATFVFDTGEHICERCVK